MYYGNILKQYMISNYSVANNLIKAGELFSERNITVKRPGVGISPMQWNKVIGSKAKKDFEPDELIEL